MSNVPEELRYTEDHEWVMVEENVATIGITDHAQTELGDITFVELPEDGTMVNAGDEVATVESVKAASPVFSPVSGEIVEVNAELEDAPETINQEPYGAGWIFRVELKDAAELEKLMSAEDYEGMLKNTAEDD